MTVTIRAAKPGDVETIADFQVKMASESEDLDLDRDRVSCGVSAVVNDKTKGDIFVACNSSEILGSVMLTREWSDWRNSEIWWIQSLYVLPEHRGKKVFSTLFQHLKKLANDQGMPYIRLYVEKNNHHAQKVYRSLGMTKEHYDLYELSLQ